MGRFCVGSGRDNLKCHKVRMCIRPRHRLSFCIKESVDNDGLKLARSTSAQTSCFSTNDRRSSVDCDAGPIWENNLAPVRNSPWIDGAMSGI